MATAAAGGCAAGTTTSDNGDDSSSNGASGGGGEGGSAGEGGTFEGPCGIDCSAIEVEGQCQEARCNETSGQCQIGPVDDGTACDDGLFCSAGDACLAGECAGGPTNNCGMLAPTCNLVECDETTKSCKFTPSTEGTPCSSDQLCTVNAHCQNGLCIGAEKDCFFSPVLDDCHVSQCNPDNGECQPFPANEGMPCIDPNDLCSVGDLCNDGSCTGGIPVDCSHLTLGCANGTCNPTSGECAQEVVATGEECLEASDDCNAGSCQANGSCLATPANEGGACDDGDPCTNGETCDSGSCGDGSPVASNLIFEEDFEDNSEGWTLGTEWTIGTATGSTGHEYGNPDPTADTTGEGGVAGAAIGGNVTTALHGFQYLTSPVIDTSALATVWLGYQRWLNSDYAPYMVNVVEVYDGTTWVKIWQSGSSPGVADASWTQMLHDVTDYKNAQMQVRFGHSVGLANALSVSGWNIDEVAIGNVVCAE